MERIEKYFIDSDVLIDFLRGLIKIRDFLFKLKEGGRLVISVINVTEVYSGKEIKNSKKKEIVNDFLSEFEIIPLDEGLAKFAGELRCNYQLPFADSIIAATAIKTDSILITRNLKHFSKIKELKLGKITE